jgi:tRNA (adenine-N(1)-)-methyltransferase non-catalytic subunit
VQNNAELVDGPNQTLSAADVRAFKEELQGKDVVDAIAEGSSTFADKTEFSQEKWRKRKSKKYILYVTARKPTSRLICQVLRRTLCPVHRPHRPYCGLMQAKLL